MRSRLLGFRRLPAGERGSQLVEAALVLPLFLALVVGIFWIGRAYNVYQSITRAAREGARFAVAPSCGGCTPANTFPTTDEVKTVINNALAAASMDSTKVNPAISITSNQVLNPSDPSSNQVQGTIVTFGYPVKLTIPFTPLNATTVTITTKVQMRQEF
ncbi:MAG: TadE/TadG family type IV pilus assembly protein [Candidatus Acidiferrales bacterium]